VRLDCRDGSLDAVWVAYIEFRAKGLPAESVNFAGKRCKGVLVPAGDGQVGARLRKRAGKVLAQAAAGSSYKSYSSG
jgi:hypothetical protein